MDISSAVNIKGRDEKEGVWVSWDDELSFFVHYIGKHKIKEARKNSLISTVNKKTHRVEETVDEEKFDNIVMDMAFSDWKGMKGKHLAQILDPSVTQINIPEDKMEEEIKFTPEDKAIVLATHNLDFYRFISNVSTEIDIWRSHQEDEALKNLKSSQSGQPKAESPVSSAQN